MFYSQGIYLLKSEEFYKILHFYIIDKNFHEEYIMMRLYFNIKQGSYLHPGFLSFGSVRNYTLISPSYSLHVFDACLRLVK